MTLDAKIEAILFATARAQSVKRLAELCEVDAEDVQDALKGLAKRLTESGGAVQLTQHGSEAELTTRPDAADLVRHAMKTEAQGELTRPSLEALAILAYRGPMTRPELEQIRGVQSSLILRNLMMRGLVEMREDVRLGQPLYGVTLDFLKHVGVGGLEELPDYSALHAEPAVEQVLNELQSPEPANPDARLSV